MRKRFLCAVLLIMFGILTRPVIAEIQSDFRETVRKRIRQEAPNLVKVEEIQFDGVKVALRGRSENVNAAANFVSNIKADPMFTMPEDVVFRKIKDSNPVEYEFEFHFKVRTPSQ